jgi:hypothetical protein
MARQQTPWEIGRTYYDQTDLYTRSANIEAAGYGRGPSAHPEEGSYAYKREPQPHPNPQSPPAGEETGLFEREAWPWLNYRGPEDDPYFAYLRPEKPGFFARAARALTTPLGRLFGVGRDAESRRIDKRICDDVGRAFDFRADLDSADIEISVNRAHVRLDGTVPDRHSKLLAEETARGIRDVVQVHNRLQIREDDPTEGNPVFVLPLSAW